jgi:hypothetical protein
MQSVFFMFLFVCVVGVCSSVASSEKVSLAEADKEFNASQVVSSVYEMMAPQYGRFGVEIKPENVIIKKYSVFEYNGIEIVGVSLGVENISKEVPPFSQTLFISKDGSLEFNPRTTIPEFIEAKHLLEPFEFDHLTGDLIFKGDGEHDVTLVTDPFCPYCRNAYNHFRNNRQGIRGFRVIEVPKEMHPGSMQVNSLAQFVIGEGVSPVNVYDFIYNEMNLKNKIDQDRETLIRDKFEDKFIAVDFDKYDKNSPVIAKRLEEHFAPLKNTEIKGTPLLIVDDKLILGLNLVEIEYFLNKKSK